VNEKEKKEVKSSVARFARIKAAVAVRSHAVSDGDACID